MATAVNTVLISQETSHTNTATYYKATLVSLSKSGTTLNFSVKVDVTLGSASSLGTGSDRVRRVYIYNSSGNLISSTTNDVHVIKDANTEWVGGGSYSKTIPCTVTVNPTSGTLSGCYIRILYTTSNAYGATSSCYWDGSKSTNGGNVGNKFSISYDTTALKITYYRNTSSSDTTTEEITYKYGGNNSFYNPTSWSKTGYRMDHWNSKRDGSGTNSWDLGGELTNDRIVNNSPAMNVYLQWEVASYTLTIKPNGGSILGGTSDWVSNGSADRPHLIYGTGNWYKFEKATRTGYAFKGYYTAASGGTQVYGADGVCIPGTSYWDANSKYCYAGNLTVYAQWTPNTYTISFDANGGSGSMSSTSATYDESVTLRTNSFTRPGYEFLGWSTSSTATTATYTDGDSVKNLTSTAGGSVTLYAVWKLATNIKVYHNGKWVYGIPYVYTGGTWKRGLAYVYKDNEWKI